MVSLIDFLLILDLELRIKFLNETRIFSNKHVLCYRYSYKDFLLTTNWNGKENNWYKLFITMGKYSNEYLKIHKFKYEKKE